MAQQRKYNVEGMHCASCEVIIERAVRKLPGVSNVKANQAGWVKIWSDNEPNLTVVNGHIGIHGYRILSGTRTDKVSFKRIGGVILMIAAVYVLFRRFNLAPNLVNGEELSLSVVFVMGLVAAISSCIAVTGGLLVAVSTAYTQAHPEATSRQKFRPHIFFNLGRIVSYTLLGAAVGALGSVLALSSMGSGIVTLAASLTMILLGLRLLNIFPWFSRFTIQPPKFIAHRLHDSAGNTRAWAPFLMGAGTFFLPCGFTQALQLYVLTRGDASIGAVTMFVFSLGTLPALMSLGAITSFIKGRWQKVVATVAGAAVVALGLININYGANLTGLSTELIQARENVMNVASRQVVEVQDPNVTVVDGVQVVKMNVVARGYSPNHFTIHAGLPVRWEITGVNTYGCQSIIELPDFNIIQSVKQGLNVVEFTPRGTGQYIFRCPMGMYTGSFTILPAAKRPIPAGVPLPDNTVSDCDPTKASCI
ncbi:MAG: sulfite exporter TauE/SafE family protein [Patescibacteria group bacterium]